MLSPYDSDVLPVPYLSTIAFCKHMYSFIDMCHFEWDVNRTISIFAKFPPKTSLTFLYKHLNICSVRYRSQLRTSEFMDLTLLLPSNYMELLPRHTNFHNLSQKWLSTSIVDFEDVCELWDYVVDKEEVIPILKKLLETRPFGVYCKATATELPDDCQAIIRQEWEKEVNSDFRRCMNLIKMRVDKQIFDSEWHKLFPMKPDFSSLLLLEDVFSLVRNYLDYDSLKWVRKVCSAWKHFLPIRHYLIVDALVLDYNKYPRTRVHMFFESGKMQISRNKWNENIPAHTQNLRFVRRILPIYDSGLFFAFGCDNDRNPCSAFRFINLENIQSLKPLLKNNRKKLELREDNLVLSRALWSFQNFRDDDFVVHLDLKENFLELHMTQQLTKDFSGYYFLEILLNNISKHKYVLGFGEQDSQHVFKIPLRDDLDGLREIILRVFKHNSNYNEKGLRNYPFEYFPPNAFNVTAPYVNFCHKIL